SLPQRLPDPADRGGPGDRLGMPLPPADAMAMGKGLADRFRIGHARARGPAHLAAPAGRSHPRDRRDGAPSRVLHPVPRGVAVGMAGGQRADAGAAYPVALPRREAGMSDSRHPPGLWFIPGDGVLARLGDLILLSRTADDGLLDRLLDGLTRMVGDGRELADLAEDAIRSVCAWPTNCGSERSPAVVAIGPDR